MSRFNKKNGRPRCEYNKNKNPPEFLPVIECGKKAKFQVNISDAITEEESDHNFCKKHYNMIKDCSNVSPEVIEL
jgi:hypothetical protein